MKQFHSDRPSPLGWTGCAGVRSTPGWWPDWVLPGFWTFDTVGRKPMIGGTYLISGGSLMISAWLFGADKLNATTQTFVRVVIFFFASAGASAAYLTVSETWPIEIRAEAIAVFLRHRPDLRSPGPRVLRCPDRRRKQPIGSGVGLCGRRHDHGGQVASSSWSSGSRPRDIRGDCHQAANGGVC
jgi:hypothetical protein